IESLQNKNSQNEYYLTDIIEKGATEGQRVSGIAVDQVDEIIGVNTVPELMAVERVLQKRMIEKLAGQQVCFADPTSVTIHPSSTIAKSVSIGPNTYILEGCSIGEGVTIEGSCYLKNVSVGKGSTLRFGLRAE